MAVQLAHWKGAKVIATASKENHDFLKQLGADQTVDYRAEKFEDVAKDVDVVLDTVGGETQARSFGVIKKGGTLGSIVGRPDGAKADASGVRAAGMLVQVDAGELAQIGKLLDDGKIKPVVTHVFPLADADKAQEQSETRHTRGKIVLEVVKESATGGPAPQSMSEQNKRLVLAFYDEVFNKHDVAAAEKYLAEDYKQHNPMAATGRKAFMDFFGRFFQQSPEWRVQIKRVAADGDLVWVHYHAQKNADDRGMAVVDILRVQDGMIVEHWDVVQSVPQKSANENGMF